MAGAMRCYAGREQRQKRKYVEADPAEGRRDAMRVTVRVEQQAGGEYLRQSVGRCVEEWETR